MKKRNILIAAMIPTVPVSLGLTFGLMNAQKAPFSELGQLQAFAQNTEELKEYLKDDYEQLSIDLQTNNEYINWISQFDDSNLTDINGSIVEIGDLNMTLKEKSFLLMNYLEKVDTRTIENNVEKLQIPEVASTRSSSGVDFNYLYTKDKYGNYEQVYNSFGQKVRRSGSDRRTTRYSTFKDDITHIYMSNQTVLDNAYLSYQAEMEMADNASKNKLKQKVGTNGYYRIEYLLNSNTITYETASSNDRYLLDAYKDNYYDFLRETERISAPYYFNGIAQEGNNYSRASMGVLVISFIYNFAKQSLNDGEKSDFSEFASDILGAGLKVATNLGIKTITTKLGGAIGSIWGPGGAVIGAAIGWLTGTAIGLVLSIVETGNGYTIWENFDDHGLNDWNFQWKSNRKNMSLNGIHWSERYTKGVYWKVTDGWFYTPRLYIGTQGEGLRNISGTTSTGNSFNWGNKIGVYYK